MDKNKREIMQCLNDQVNMRLKNRVNQLLLSSVSRMNDSKYRSYTIEDFLVLFKIEKLFEEGIILKDEYDNLIELFNIKMDIESKYGKLLDDTSIENQKIYLTLYNIDKLFEKYNLKINHIDLEQIMISVIENENYDSIDNNQMENLIRVLKSK